MVRLRHGKGSGISCEEIQVFTRLFIPDPPTIVCNRLRGAVRFLSGPPKPPGTKERLWQPHWQSWHTPEG
jgi:hypothetical protein